MSIVSLTDSLKLASWHGEFEEKEKWRVAPYVEIQGEESIRRTKGNPITVTSIWEQYGEMIKDVSHVIGVPIEIIVATIATESGGDPRAVRKEPGFIDVRKTPNRISVGLMQTLISTARSFSEYAGYIGLKKLQDPLNSLFAGAKYYRHLIKKYGSDPVLCAAAYNSGGIYYSSIRKFGLRCYTKGRYNHILKFIAWYNDFVYVLLQEEYD